LMVHDVATTVFNRVMDRMVNLRKRSGGCQQ